MREDQNTEFKASWRDEHLKIICAFANTNGGKLYIGINDDGEIIGVKDSKKLMDDIPNKAINYLGIIVGVILHQSEKYGLDHIEIVVHQSSVPISYRGVYFVKSGSTRQELKGVALQQFIIKKMGKTFDELPADGADINNIDQGAVKKFVRKALNVNRIPPEAELDNIPLILKNLNLLTEDGQIKNAAILLFGKNPRKYFVSAYFAIGRFGISDDDLKYQDIIEGNIFEMPGKVMETLRAKYLVSPIRYEGLQRIEELEYPEESLREAILNAVVHKDYTGAHIQLSVYDDKLILWNEGRLPAELTIEMLREKHPSRPHNKNVADIFFKSGYIEAWGRGIAKILLGCQKAKLPEPIIEESSGGVQITFFKSKEKSKEKSKGKSKEKIMEAIRTNPHITTAGLIEVTGLTASGVEKNLRTLKQQGILQRIGSRKSGYWKLAEV